MINTVLHIHIDNMTICLRVPQKPWRISDPLALEHDQTQYIYIYTWVYGVWYLQNPMVYIYHVFPHQNWRRYPIHD